MAECSYSSAIKCMDATGTNMCCEHFGHWYPDDSLSCELCGEGRDRSLKDQLNELIELNAYLDDQVID